MTHPDLQRAEEAHANLQAAIRHILAAERTVSVASDARLKRASSTTRQLANRASSLERRLNRITDSLGRGPGGGE